MIYTMSDLFQMMQGSKAASEDTDLYAVARHLEANRKTGKIVQYIILICVLVAIFEKSFWPLAIGICLCAITFYVLISSSMRRVEKETGISIYLQSILSRRYKSDPEYAAKVDAVFQNGLVPLAPYKTNPVMDDGHQDGPHGNSSEE